MTPHRMPHWMTLVVCASMVIGAGTLAIAQDADAEATGDRVVMTWETFVKISGYDPSGDAPRVLTIPWSEIEEMLGVKVERVGDGATVDLPWQEFKALLEWSVQRDKPEEDPPPQPYIITSSEYAGELSDAGASLTLRLEATVLQEDGWKRIPVLPSGVAVREATLKPADGVYLNATGGGYELLTRKSGAIEAEIAFAVETRESGGVHSVQFARRHAGSSVLKLNFADEDVDVTVAGAQSKLDIPGGDGKVVTAALAGGTPVQVSWQRALPEAEPLEPKLYAETRTLIAVADDMLVGRAHVDYNILHSPVRELAVSVPKGVSVLTVRGGNVETWRVEDGALTVQLRGEAVGSYALQVSYERAGSGLQTVPVLRPSGVERDRGYVGVVALSNVELSAPADELSGATEIDVRRLPGAIAAMTNQPILLGFRYVGDAVHIPLTIRSHKAVGVLITIADNATYTGMQLPDGRRMTKATYAVRNNRNQFLRMKMPDGAAIWSASVGGKPVSPATDEKGNVLIPLIRSSGTSSELTSFPVEMVYVETPADPAPSAGKLHVGLPVCNVPVMHVMYRFYAPAEGTYTVGWGKSGFSGALELVEQFTSLATGAATAVKPVKPAAETQQMAQQFRRRADDAVAAGGATPIRVRLPINGKLFKLEKILALPDDELFFDVTYRDWKRAE
ncbi:MAG: hypothetical protein KGY99_10400 [Phycisphaerae bacterium]|nr:hypothetical protein [Phycisphaerae bacterium]